MGLEPALASEPVYAEGADGVRRLVAAPGDVIPETPPAAGISRRIDPPSASREPFDGYDQLTEEQVVAMLHGLDTDALEAVRAYERTHLARGAIHQFGLTAEVVRGGRRRGPSTRTVSQRSVSAAYSDLDDDELVAEIARRSLVVSATGAAAKVRKARIAALVADDAKDSD